MSTEIFLAVIGKRFASPGLHDINVEARLLEQKLVNQMLNGKMYNYGIRIFKVIFEALQRVKLDLFQEWLQKEKKSDILSNYLESEVFAELIKKRESSMFNTCLQSISALLKTYNEFEMKICNGDFDSMAMFWQSYLDMVQVLLDFVKSILLPDWNFCLQSTEKNTFLDLIMQDFLVTIGAVSKRLKKISYDLSTVSTWKIFPAAYKRKI